MRIACPYCQAAYRIADVTPGTVLVCHRCGTEFAVESTEPEELAEVVAAAEDQLLLFGRQTAPARSKPGDLLRQPATAETISGTALQDASLQDEAAGAESPDLPEPPRRRNVQIWPWLVATLLLTAVSGFVVQKDAWLDNPWLRSTLINLGLPLEVRDKDWLVLPETVQAQWLKRTDGSRVLVIEGRLANQLSCELPPPKLVIDFYADDEPDRIARTELLPITLPPSMDAVRHAPYQPPAIDDVPVAPRSERGFMLVVESLPPRIADFTLTAQAVQP